MYSEEEEDWEDWEEEWEEEEEEEEEQDDINSSLMEMGASCPRRGPHFYCIGFYEILL